MKILALRRSYSFQPDYNKLVQNDHLLLLGIGSTLCLFYARSEWMLVPSWRHSTKRKKELKLSKSKKLTVLFLFAKDLLLITSNTLFPILLQPRMPSRMKQVHVSRKAGCIMCQSFWLTQQLYGNISQCIFLYRYLKKQRKDIQALCKWEHWGHFWFQSTVSFVCISTPK